VLTLKRGLQSLETLLRRPWPEIEPGLSELLASGKLAWDGSRFQLSDPEYAERRRKTSRDRMAAKRARDAASNDADVQSDVCDASDVTPVTPTPGDACDVTSLLISSDLPSGSDPIRSDQPGRSDQPPGWFLAAVATAEQAGCPVPEAEVSQRYIQYLGSATNRKLAPTQAGAGSWLVSTLRAERSKAAADAERRGRGGGPRGDRQPHSSEWLENMRKTGSGGDF
jgi:hypothetical protein